MAKRRTPSAHVQVAARLALVEFHYDTPRRPDIARISGSESLIKEGLKQGKLEPIGAIEKLEKDDREIIASAQVIHATNEGDLQILGDPNGRTITGAGGSVKPLNSSYPAIYFYESGIDGESSFKGAYDSAVAIRTDIHYRRDRSLESRTEELENIELLDQLLLQHISQGHRLRSRISLVGDYNEDLKVIRRIRTLMVKR